MSALQSAKLWLVQHLGLAKDALHIYVGLALLLGCVILFRWPLRSWKPWAVVALAAANWHDIWNTLFWPTMLMLLARYTRVLRR